MSVIEATIIEILESIPEGSHVIVEHNSGEYTINYEQAQFLLGIYKDIKEDQEMVDEFLSIIENVDSIDVICEEIKNVLSEASVP